jgi:exonuclease VII small subunit
MDNARRRSENARDVLGNALLRLDNARRVSDHGREQLQNARRQLDFLLSEKGFLLLEKENAPPSRSFNDLSMARRVPSQKTPHAFLS